MPIRPRTFSMRIRLKMACGPRRRYAAVHPLRKADGPSFFKIWENQAPAPPIFLSGSFITLVFTTSAGFAAVVVITEVIRDADRCVDCAFLSMPKDSTNILFLII